MASPTHHDLRHAISLRPSPFHHSHPYRTQSPARPASLTPGAAAAAATADSSHESDAVDTAEAKRPTVVTASEGTTTALEGYRTSNAFDPLSRHGAARDDGDLERQSLPQYAKERDPYQLAPKLKTANEIDAIKARIKANSSRKRLGCATLTSPKEQWRAHKIGDFYANQNENIERLLKPVDDHVREAKEEQGDNQLKYKIAVRGSFAANILLAGLQLYGATSSGSLSLFTTMADAMFDPLSNVTLILCHRAVNRVDPRRFPSGKARIETAGNICFCFLMTTVSAIIIVQSIQELTGGSKEPTKGFHLPSVIAVATAFVVKFSLFCYCWSLRNKYSQIRILWEDHRNDLFVNGFGLLTSVGGSKLKWFIDPAGAIGLSCLVIFLWFRTAWSEFQLLIGVSADPNFLQLITYISMTHDETMVSAVDTVRAYHSGPRMIVEVDIVMHDTCTLRDTHDVAEALQTKLESLPSVERAYVHVDYETSHAPEHFWKKQL